MEALIIAVLSAIGGLVGGYFGAYFKKKGENLATKDDIGDITKIVQGVESEFKANNEILRSTLDLTRQHRLDWKTAERDAYFEFVNTSSIWIYNLVRISTFTQYGLSNYRELYKKGPELEKLKYLIDVAVAHLALFLDDKNFFGNIYSEFNVSTLEFEGYILETINQITRTINKTEIKIKGKDQESMEVLAAKLQLTVDIDKITKERLPEFLEKYTVAHTKFVNNLNYARKRIKEINSF